STVWLMRAPWVIRSRATVLFAPCSLGVGRCTRRRIRRVLARSGTTIAPAMSGWSMGLIGTGATVIWRRCGRSLTAPWRTTGVYGASTPKEATSGLHTEQDGHSLPVL